MGLNTHQREGEKKGEEVATTPDALQMSHRTMTGIEVLPGDKSHKVNPNRSQQQVVKLQEPQEVSEKLPSDVNQLPPTPSQNVDARPNGGFLAWIQVVCSFCLYFNTYGIIASFGIFQTYYESNLRYHPSKASIIGSIQSFLIFFATALSGPLYDAGLHRYVVTAGSFMVVFGIMMQSLCKEYWQFILAQSLCVGIGGGFIAFLGPAVLSTHFTTKYPLASGIGAAGGGVAGIVLPIVFRQLQPSIGFGWAVRILGFISLGTLIIPVAALRPRSKPASQRKAIDTTAFSDIPFVVLLIGNFIMLLGVFTPFFYVQSFALDSGIAGEELSFYIIAIMNLTSALGRIIPNFFSSRLGPFNMFLLMNLVTFVIAFGFIGVTSLPGLIVTAAIYGFSTGSVFALQPVVVIRLCPDPKLIGTRVGMAFCFLSFALLPSTPIAGALQTRGGFTGVWAWTGATTAVGFFIMSLSRGIKTNWTLVSKA